MNRPVWMRVANAIAMLLIVFIGGPCIFFGCLGLSGHLADTSRAENEKNGLIFVMIAVASAMPLIMIKQDAWRKRPKQGVCLHCGYDLRATPDRCPECGTVAT